MTVSATKDQENLIERLEACDARDTPAIANDLMSEAADQLSRLTVEGLAGVIGGVIAHGTPMTWRLGNAERAMIAQALFDFITGSGKEGFGADRTLCPPPVASQPESCDVQQVKP